MKRAFIAAAVLATACSRPAPRTIEMPELDGPVANRTTPDDDFRNKPPLGAEEKLSIPKIEDRRLKNGIRVLFVERHDAPVIALHIVSDRGGDQAEPGIPEFFERAALMASETRPYWEVNETANALGMTLTADVTHDATIVSTRVLSKLFPAGTELLGDLIAHPTFPNSRVTLTRQRIRASLSATYGNPEGQLEVAVHHALFPPEHRYHHPLAPAASIDKVDAEILAAYQRFAFTPAHLTLAVAGDTTIDSVLPILERAFGSLQGPKVGAQQPPAPPSEVGPEPRFIVINKPTGSQANIAVAWLAPTFDSPDRIAFLIASEILEHALNEDLRVHKGITYGMTSFGGPMRGRTPFGVSGSVEIGRVGDAAQSIVMHTEKLLSGELVTNQELSDSKTSLIGSRAYFEGIGRTAHTLELLAAYSLPLDYPTVRAAALTACPADQVRAAAERYLPLSRMRIVVVGDAAKIVPQLQKLSLGKVMTSAPFTP